MPRGGGGAGDGLASSGIDGFMTTRKPEGGVMALIRVCIYTRISTDEENQPTSLHSQRERLEAFCKAQEGWRIVAHKQDQATGTSSTAQVCKPRSISRGPERSTCCSSTASTDSHARYASSRN